MNYSAYQEIFIAMILGMSYVFGKIKTKDKRSEKVFNILCVAAFASFVVILLTFSVFNRAEGSHQSIVMRPFWSYKTVLSVYACFDVYKQIIDNVLVFLPFGFLFPQVFKLDKNKNCYIITAVGGLVLSCIIEALQFLMSRGVCEIDDIFNNTCGSIIGCGIFCFIKFAKIENDSLVLKKNWIISFVPLFTFLIVIFIISFYRENILAGTINC